MKPDQTSRINHLTGEKTLRPDHSAAAAPIFSESLSTDTVEVALYNAAEKDLFLLGLLKRSISFAPLTGERAYEILSCQFSNSSIEEMNLLLSCIDAQIIREWVTDCIDFFIMQQLIAEDPFSPEPRRAQPVDQALRALLDAFREQERVALIVNEVLESFRHSPHDLPIQLDKQLTPLQIRQAELRDSEKFQGFKDSVQMGESLSFFTHRERPVPSYPVPKAEHPLTSRPWESLHWEKLDHQLEQPARLSNTDKEVVSQITRQTLLNKTKAFLAQYKTKSQNFFSSDQAMDLLGDITRFRTLSQHRIIDSDDALHLTMELKRLVLPHLSDVVATTESPTRKGSPALWTFAAKQLKGGETALSTQGPNGQLMSMFESVLKLRDTFSETQILQLAAICRGEENLSSIVSGGKQTNRDVARAAFDIFTNSLSAVSENFDQLAKLLDSSLLIEPIKRVKLAALVERATAELSREFLRGEFDQTSEIAWQASTLCDLARGRVPDDDVRALESLVDAIFLGDSHVRDDSKWWRYPKARGLLFISAWKDSLESPGTLNSTRSVILTTIARESATGLITDLNTALAFTGGVINEEAFSNELRQRILAALSSLPLPKARNFIDTFAECFPGILDRSSIEPLALYSAIACNPYSISAILCPTEEQEIDTFLELLAYIKTHTSTSAPKNLSLNFLCALLSSPDFNEAKLPKIHSLLGTTGSVEDIFSKYEKMKRYYCPPSDTSRAPLPITSSELKAAIDEERVVLCTDVVPAHGTSSRHYQGLFVFSDGQAKQRFIEELIESNQLSYSSTDSTTPEHLPEFSLASPYTETIFEDVVPEGTQRVALTDDLWGLIMEVTGYCKERILYNARKARPSTYWRD